MHLQEAPSWDEAFLLKINLGDEWARSTVTFHEPSWRDCAANDHPGKLTKTTASTNVCVPGMWVDPYCFLNAHTHSISSPWTLKECHVNRSGKCLHWRVHGGA